MSWADKRVEYDRKVREKRKAAGLCYQCGQPLPGGDWSVGRCPDCDKKIKSYLTARYYKRKEAGLCVSCGKPAWNGHIYCREHVLKQDDRCREYQQKKTKERKERQKK